MQIICMEAKLDKHSDAYQEAVADLFLVDTGVLLKGVVLIWDEQGRGVVRLPGAVAFVNVLYERAFAALAIQSVLLRVSQEAIAMLGQRVGENALLAKAGDISPDASVGQS